MLYTVQNCWFCNLNSEILTIKKNSWTCTHCKQYNGFDKEGDYNKEIKEMFQSNTENKFSKKKLVKPFETNTNCLCDHCNYYQQLKIEKLAEFKPKDEETYDDEIKNYKDYLEKIYEICDKCKSNVNFEITKQNGVLKEYFMNIRNFYDKHKLGAKSKFATTKTSKIQQGQFKFSTNMENIIKAISFSLIFLLATLTLLYNDNKVQELDSSSLILTYQYYFTQILNETIIRSRETVFNSRFNFNLSTRDEIFAYFNKIIPFFLMFMYPICALVVFLSKKNRNNYNFYSNVSIWAIDLVLILSHYKQFMIIFKSNLNDYLFSNVTISFDQNVLFLIPIIQTIIVTKLTSSIFELLFKKKQPILKHKLLNDFQSTITKNPTFKSTQKDVASQPNDDSVQFNYDSMPRSYTLMKYIELDTNNFQSQTNPTVGSTTNTLVSKKKTNSSATRPAIDVIKSSRLAASDFNKSKLIRNNSIDDSMDRLSNNSGSNDSDESSIISGLTNLYLNKTNNNVARSNMNLFESESNLLNRSAEVTNLNGSLYHSSFYQDTTTNRSYMAALNNKSSKLYHTLQMLQ